MANYSVQILSHAFIRLHIILTNVIETYIVLWFEVSLSFHVLQRTPAYGFRNCNVRPVTTEFLLQRYVS